MYDGESVCEDSLDGANVVQQNLLSDNSNLGQQNLLSDNTNLGQHNLLSDNTNLGQQKKHDVPVKIHVFSLMN